MCGLGNVDPARRPRERIEFLRCQADGAVVVASRRVNCLEAAERDIEVHGNAFLEAERTDAAGVRRRDPPAA